MIKLQDLIDTLKQKRENPQSFDEIEESSELQARIHAAKMALEDIVVDLNQDFAQLV